MKKVIFLWGCLAFAQACCLADEVIVEGIAYTDVKILSVGVSTVKFRLSGGRLITKALAEIDRISLAGATKFNQAEEQFSKQKYARAIELYTSALRTPGNAQRKALIRRRLALAKKRQAEGPPTKEPHPGSKVTGEAADSSSCSACKGTGVVPCPECEGTGLAKCKNCNGVGRVTCPVCKGHWEKGRCAKCKGAGGAWVIRPKRVTKETLGGKVRRHKIVMERVWVPCNHYNPGFYVDGKYYPGWYCKGRKGYKTRWYCPTCENEPVKAYKGTVPCPVCHGKGRVGPCPVCKGTKQVPCEECGGTGRRVKSEAELVHSKRLRAGPLASPDALAASLAKGPADPREDKTAWGKLTSLQQVEALRKYNEQLAAWREGRLHVGEQIIWRLALRDVRPNKDTGGYLVESRSEGGVLVEANVPAAAARQVLLKLKKSQPIQLKGVIAAYRIGQQGAEARRPGRGKGLLRVEIDQAVITPAGKSGS